MLPASDWNRVFALTLFLAGTSPALAESHEWILRATSPEQASVLISTARNLPDLQLEAALPFAEDDPAAIRSLLRLRASEALQLEKLVALSGLDLSQLLWIEPAPLRSTDLLPNDPDYNLLWGLDQIQAPAAWDLHTGSGAIVVAVVDTGVDLEHPDLAAGLWQNEAELAGTPGVDDDGNGWIDDFHGADPFGGDGEPQAEAGDLSHGTHTAGTAACVTNNGLGVACPAWNARLMPVRAGHGTLISRGVEGIWYAATNGAHIISCSYGGDSYSSYEREVIQAAQEMGVLIVASAGNDGSSSLHYPAAYEGVLAVASTDSDDHKLSSSQYGWWVDLAAPGSSIWSTVIGGGYGYKTGTSMSTPLVASLAALVWSHYPSDNAWQIAARLGSGADNIDGENPAWAGQLGHGRINAEASLQVNPLALRLADVELLDEDGNGLADPGETITLSLLLEGVLGNLTDCSIAASLLEGEGQLLLASASFPSLAEGQQMLLEDALILEVASTADPGSHLLLELAVSGAQGFSSTLHLQIPVAPQFVTHRNGNMVLSLDGRARIGFHDFLSNQPQGEGLRWPATSPGHLYHGSLAIALDDGNVLHGASYLLGVETDFAAAGEGGVNLRQEGDLWIAEADFLAPELPGLLVQQRSTSLAGANWILLEWTISNTGQQAFAGLQPGLWLDLDIAGSWSDDEGAWSPDGELGWMGDGGAAHIGVRLLDEPLQNFRVCSYGEWTGAGLEDEELWAYMHSGFSQSSSSGPGDYQLCLAAAAAELAPGASRSFRVVLLGANGVDDLRICADEAMEWWLSGVEPGALRPQQIELSIAPNPFNPVTQIRMILPEAGPVKLLVHDLGGRCLLQQNLGWQQAGRLERQLDGRAFASGCYLVEVSQNGRSQVQPVLLVK
jgi:serine protease